MKVRQHLEKCMPSGEVMEESIFANLCMHIAASNIDLKTIKRPLIKVSTRFKYWWRVPISGMAGPNCSGGAQGMYDYIWAHASSSTGVIGALKMGKVLKSFTEDSKETYGFYCMACPLENKDWDLTGALEKAWGLNKNSSKILVGGTATNRFPTAKATGVSSEQRACGEYGVVHGHKRWCIRPSLSKITELWVSELRDVSLTPE
jgi:hypothetical protein